MAEPMTRQKGRKRASVPARVASPQNSGTKFTRGPWINCNDSHIESEHDGTVIVEEMNTELGMLTDEEITANANVIAAAPDLYEALERFRDRAQSWHDFHRGTAIQCDELCECIPPAEAALVKANPRKD